jgi:predicted deacetylase
VPPSEQRALCVAIHDVAPATWPACQRLQQAVREVADIPLTWLVVPHYHGNAARSPLFDKALDAVLARGDELALHGYTHLDTGPAPAGLRARLLRTLWTEKEGEFAALEQAEALHLLELGLEWFAQRSWPVDGFVAPAWLLGPHTWTALQGLPFSYTTTCFHLVSLPQIQAHWAPSLVYAARNRAGRLFSPPAASVAAQLLGNAPLLRLALHPRDALHPALLHHLQQLLERLLDHRHACTKLAAARSYQYLPPMPQ